MRVKLPEGRLCVDREVVVDIFASCELDEDNETVRVVLESALKEGTSCSTDDVEDRAAQGPLTVPACSDPAACEQTATLSLKSSGVGGGDKATITLTLRNVRDDESIELPNVQPENLRKVTFSGDIDIVDDEIFGNERKSFVLGEECIVDPFDREQDLSWSQCVGDEVRLRLEIKCTLALDHVGVNVRIVGKLFEGVSCNSNDQDGKQTREFVVNPCNGSCVPSTTTIRIRNNDKDQGNAMLSMVNEQR